MCIPGQLCIWVGLVAIALNWVSCLVHSIPNTINTHVPNSIYAIVVSKNLVAFHVGYLLMLVIWLVFHRFSKLASGC